MSKLYFAIAISVLGCSSTRGLTATSREALTTCIDVVATGDATISDPPMDHNFGAQPTMRAGGHDESLVRFDAPSLPAGAVVDRALLKLYVSGGPKNTTVNVHRAAADWNEA